MTLARRHDGIYIRGKTWWLDFRHDGKRHIVRLGKGINKTVAHELAGIKRGDILKGEAGIAQKRANLSFDKAAEDFLTWAKANKRPKTITSYRLLHWTTQALFRRQDTRSDPTLCHREAQKDAGRRKGCGVGES